MPAKLSFNRPMMNQALYPMVRRTLQQWWDKHQRYFPWRSTGNPYHIFLAEMLLQKTQAIKAEKAFALITASYCDIESLSNASLPQLEEIFGWLGLTKRAGYLLRASQKLVTSFEGQLPQSFDDLKDLPGVGDYSANAILCFAFHQSRPILDSSISRVLQRLLGYKSRKKSWEDETGWRIAENFLDEARPAQHNYALIDLAALLCTPTNPACAICPLNAWCIYAGMMHGQ